MVFRLLAWLEKFFSRVASHLVTSSSFGWTTAPKLSPGSKPTLRSGGSDPFPGSEELPKDKEAANAAAEREKDGQHDDDGQEGGGQAPEEIRLAFHLVVVPDHASRAGALANDPGHVTPEPQSLESQELIFG